MGPKTNRNTRKSRNNRSISPWASPVVIVPKKSTPGKPPPRRRMCVDYRRINKLQLEVTKADSGKGCISLIPLPTRKPYGIMQSSFWVSQSIIYIW